MGLSDRRKQIVLWLKINKEHFIIIADLVYASEIGVTS